MSDAPSMLPAPRILLVEDDQLISKAYNDGLQRAGFNVMPLHDGTEVLETCRSFKPQLILLDLFMPNKDGFTVLRELQGDAELRTLPVMILTVSGQESDVRKVAKMGAVDYLIKTELSLHQVIERIRFQLLKFNLLEN